MADDEPGELGFGPKDWQKWERYLGDDAAARYERLHSIIFQLSMGELDAPQPDGTTPRQYVLDLQERLDVERDFIGSGAADSFGHDIKDPMAPLGPNDLWATRMIFRIRGEITGDGGLSPEAWKEFYDTVEASAAGDIESAQKLGTLLSVMLPES